MSEPTIESLKEAHEYPELNPAFVPVQVDEDTIHIRAGPWSGPIVTIRDVDEDSEVTKLIELLDGQTHIEDLFDSFEPDQQGEIAKILEGLYQKDILHDRDEHADDKSWPHMSLKYTFSDRNRDRLESKEPLVIDCSGLGKQVAEDLLEMGVGGIRYLEPRDTDIDTRLLESDDRFVKLDTDVETAISEANFAVYTADEAHPSLLDDVNRAAHEHDTPWLPAQIQGFDALIGPAIYPGKTACYECFKDRKQSNMKKLSGYRAYEKSMEDEDLSTLTLPAVERMVAGYVTLDLTHLLGYGTGYTSGRVFNINTLEMEIETNDVLRIPRCDVCGTSKGADYQRFISMDDVVEASNRMSDGGS